MNYYIKVGSVTNAQRARRALSNQGYKSVLKKSEKQSGEGCGYTLIVSKYGEEALRVLNENSISIYGVDRE